MSSTLSLIYTLVSTQEEAQKIATLLVAEKYAACVNILPGIQSIYEWKGEVCNSQEIALLIKTTETMQQAAIEKLKSIHPYEIPAILVFSPAESLPAFASWVELQTHQ